jgi:branched-chain amino acid transport system substrate-binding protein
LAQPLRAALRAVAAVLAACLPLAHAAAPQEPPIRIGVPIALETPVGRDAIDSMQMALDEINARTGLLGRKVELVIADEAQDPRAGVEAILKLTRDEKVDVLIGGYTSGLTLAQLPRIAQARTVYIGIGAASPAITQPVREDYATYKYVFRVSPINALHQARALADFVSGFVLGEMGVRRLAIVGENEKWVQELVPLLRAGVADAGAEVELTELVDTDTTEFSPLLSRVRDSGAEFLVLILAQAASDVLVQQWYDARVPVAIGGIHLKGMQPDYFKRLDGKSISEITGMLSMRGPVIRNMIYHEAFSRKTGRAAPAYTGPGAYDAVHVWADAVRRAKTTDADAVIRELEKTDYLGVQGRIQFDEAHDVKAGPGLVSFLFAQWQDKGERVIVWPRELRTGRWILPPWMKR